MKRDFLGEFEELVLTIVALLKDNAYGNAIVKEFHNRFHREVNLSAVHITLYRLEDKALLNSEMSEPLNERGGRRKRIYSLTNSGWAQLKTLKRQRQQLWKQIPQLK